MNVEGAEEDIVGALCDLCENTERIANALETIAAYFATITNKGV